MRQDKTISSIKDINDMLPDLVLTIDTISLSEMLEPVVLTECGHGSPDLC